MQPTKRLIATSIRTNSRPPARHTEQIADSNAYTSDLDRRLQQLVTSHRSLAASS